MTLSASTRPYASRPSVDQHYESLTLNLTLTLGNPSWERRHPEANPSYENSVRQPAPVDLSFDLFSVIPLPLEPLLQVRPASPARARQRELQARREEMPEIGLLASGDTEANVGVGQTVCHNTSTGFGAMMRPTNPGWKDEFILVRGSKCVKYETEDTTPTGLCGGARFQHQFTGVRPGRAEFSTPYGTLRLTVTAALS